MPLCSSCSLARIVSSFFDNESGRANHNHPILVQFAIRHVCDDFIFPDIVLKRKLQMGA